MGRLIIILKIQLLQIINILIIIQLKIKWLSIVKTGWCNCADKKSTTVMDNTVFSGAGQNVGRAGLGPIFMLRSTKEYSLLD